MELIRPFPTEQVSSLWRWLHEFPLANMDDYAPQTESEFLSQMLERMAREKTWGVSKNGLICACVSFLPLTPRLGTFHGICFAKGYCSRGEKLLALRQILNELFAAGTEKIMATYFEDNNKIGPFLADLGAVKEGLLTRQTLRRGDGINVVQVAIFKGLN